MMNKTLETIHKLRSIHGNFSEKEINHEDLETILKACVRAATASSMQFYSIIVVEDRELIKKHFSYEGSKALLFCVDFNRSIDAAKALGYHYQVEGMNDFLTGTTDTILAAQTAAIAAKSLGIDSLFTNSVHRIPLKDTFETFNLPKQYCFPLVTLILGYSDSELNYKKGRLEGKGVVHYGKYEAIDVKEMQEHIMLYDDPKKHLAMHYDWMEKGYEHYLNWLHTEWLLPEAVAHKKQFVDTLVEKRFMTV